MKRNKRGVSLIALVITIIILVILAGTVIMSLSGGEIIDKARETVEKTNLYQVQELASIAWSSAYIDKMTDKDVNLYDRVIASLENNGIDVTKYNIVVDNGGVTVSKRDSNTTASTIVLDKTSITEGIVQGTIKVVGLTATVQNISGTLTWSSSNEAVAEVTGNGASGAVTLKSAGNAVITVTDGNISATCSVNVTILASALTLDITSITESILQGNTKTVVLAATAENTGTLTWSSSNTAVASVIGNGTSATVTIKAGGSAVITVTDGNVSATCSINVTEKPASTLGSLITSENYGDTVDYSVIVDGTVYDDWQIYYANEEYIYLIAGNDVASNVTLDRGTTVASLTATEKALYSKFQVGTAEKYTLVDKVGGEQAYNSQAVAHLVKDYANFANTTASYKDYVVGAIGGPTVELFVAGWNAKGYEPAMTITTGDYGYYINGECYVEVTSDELYVKSGSYHWLASPAANDSNDGPRYVMGAGCDNVSYYPLDFYYGVRPVVCLSSDIPAMTGMDTDFTIDM